MNTPSWTYRQPPLPGELLSSCLARNAAAHGTTPYRFLALFWHRDPVWERDFDRDPGALARLDHMPCASNWLDDLAERLGVPRSAVEDTTLARWREWLGDGLHPQAGDTPLILSAGVFHRTRTRYALQFCPRCLAEGRPHFRKVWRLGFVLACDIHEQPLLDCCTWCDAPVIPHRSMTPRLTDCHRCGRFVGGRADRHVEPVPEAAFALQRHLASVLRGGGNQDTGPLGAGEAFATVRALLAASASPRAHHLLRRALGLGAVTGEKPDRRRFEHARHAVRAPWLETVAAWLREWPHDFLMGADAMGASQRAFARCRLPSMLAAQVARLPRRKYKPRRPWQSLLDERTLRRLRRTDKTAYHVERAERVLRAVGRT